MRMISSSGQNNTQMENVVAFLTSEVALAEKALARFKERFETNPAHAFEWAEDAMEAAAVIVVYKDLLGWIANAPEMSFDRFVDEIVRSVVNQARYPAVNGGSHETMKALRQKTMAFLAGELRFVPGTDKKLA